VPKTNRRAVLAGAGASALAAPALSQNRREWRMVTAYPKGFPGLGTGAERIAERITEMSGGRLTIKVFSAGELVPAFGVFDAVADGTAQIGHDGASYNIGKGRGFKFFTGFAFGFSADEFFAWVAHGNGHALWEELYAPFNVYPLMAGTTGPQMFGWFRKPINSVEDFKGLKFRAPGTHREVVQRLGATQVVLPVGEIFPALEAGTLDAAELVGPYNDLAVGLHQVCKYYYGPGPLEPAASTQITINRQAWEELPEDLKAIVRAAAQSANQDILGEYVARSGPALRTLVQDHGVRLLPMSDDILAACGREAGAILRETYEEGDAYTRRLIEDFLSFRKNIKAWTRVNHLAYLNARRLPFDFELRS